MTAATATPSSAAACPHFNPMDAAHQRDPYQTYAALRRDAPVYFSPETQLWIVTRYADITAALKHTEMFSSVGAIQVGGYPPSVSAVLAQGLGEATLMVESDEPVHTRIRNVLNKAFTPQRIAQLEPQIRALTDELIDRFIDDGQTDLVTQFAILLPGLVICDLMGVPRSDFPRLKRWSSDWLDLLGASAPEERLVACAQSFVECQHYFLEQIRARQQQPREDLLTVLLPAELGGSAPVSAAEAALNALGVLVAGHETTTNMIGNSLTLLFNHPDQLARLRANPALIPQAVEEILRIDTSVQGLFRVTTRETELGGATIPAGARVFLMYASANHDETQFPEPQRFDIGRTNAREHITFARGVHVCLGAPLARLELRIALEHLLARLPNLRPADAAPERVEHVFIRGYATLPIAWDRS